LASPNVEALWGTHGAKGQKEKAQKLFVPVIVIAIVGIVLTEVVVRLERYLSRWRITERELF
jgi:ABC-type nitrate/sulfonate/bicarbonate transport system permease component